MSHNTNNNNGLGEELYSYICAVAKQQYRNSDYEDIANEAFIIATRRGYFDKRILKEAARNLNVFNTTYTEEHTILLPRSTEAFTNTEANTKTELDERISNILINTCDKRIKTVICEVIAGHNIVEACIKNNISYHHFVRECRKASMQPSLFAKEVAA